MVMRVQCPGCGKTARVPPAYYLGWAAIHCNRCHESFTVDTSGDESRPGVRVGVAVKVVPPGEGTVTPAAGPPGQVGRFQIRALLGEGAFGTVYRAYDPQLDREVALKVLRPGALDGRKAVERFQGEARSAARLRHPHIMPVYEAGQDGARYYIVFPCLEGQTLNRATRVGKIDFRRAARITCDLAEALAYAHGRGVVHRDVKPANVMLDDKGEPYLMDFGVACRQDLDQEPTPGAVLGTPSYMAPEQAGRAGGAARPVSDQYSLGALLYELLCGRPPFSGPPAIVLYNVLHREPPAPSSRRRDVPRDLEMICRKAMAKRPQDRYPGCQELADDLRRWLGIAAEGLPPGSRPSSSPRQHA